jgi:hypothetical protein
VWGWHFGASQGSLELWNASSAIQCSTKRSIPSYTFAAETVIWKAEMGLYTPRFVWLILVLMELLNIAPQWSPYQIRWTSWWYRRTWILGVDFSVFLPMQWLRGRFGQCTGHFLGFRQQIWAKNFHKINVNR